jgi:tetratricopeptide (TPR) repeat protein
VQKLKPGLVSNLLNLNLVYEKTGRADQAFAEWKKILKRQDDNPWLWLEFGDFNLRQGRQADALRAYKIAWEVSSYSSEIKKALEKRNMSIKNSKNGK